MAIGIGAATGGATRIQAAKVHGASKLGAAHGALLATPKAAAAT